MMTRDAILCSPWRSFREMWDRTDPAELEDRIRTTLRKIDGVPASWIPVDALPAPRLKDGSTLSRDWLLYLLYRQSRVKEMRPDIEARPVFEQLDAPARATLPWR